VPHLNELLGGHRKGHNLSGKLPQDGGLHQSQGGSQHHTNLAMVTAGVGRAGAGVGVGMLVDNQGIQFANNCHPGTGARAPGYPALESGQGQVVLVGNAQLLKLAGHQLSGAGLAKARLRMVQDVASDAN